MADVPQQSTEAQDAQFIIELVGRNDPDINTNFLIDKFTQKHGETATNNLITHLFSIGLVKGGHRGMIHLPPTEKNKDYRDIQRIERFLNPVKDEIKKYRGTGNPIPQKLKKRYKNIYNRFIAPFEERRAINDMQKYFASRPDMSMEERQMRMMQMRQQLAENRRRATSDEYFDFISRPRPNFIPSGIQGVAPIPEGMTQQAVDPKTGKPYTQEQLQNIMNQREAARSLQQATFRFNQLMNQQRKADAFNAKPIEERTDSRGGTQEAIGLNDKEKEELKQLQAMLQERVMPTQPITDEQRKKAIEALKPPPVRRREPPPDPTPPRRTPPRRTVDPKPPRRKPIFRRPQPPTKTTTAAKIDSPTPQQNMITPAGYRRDLKTGELIGYDPRPEMYKRKGLGVLSNQKIKPDTTKGLGSMQGPV